MIVGRVREGEVEASGEAGRNDPNGHGSVCMDDLSFLSMSSL